MNKEMTPLEALNYIKMGIPLKTSDLENALDIIETALKRLETLEEEKQSFDRKLEKKLKALEIIKEKEVDVGYYKQCNSLEEYNNECGMTYWNELTQEEFDLLKEVLL